LTGPLSEEHETLLQGRLYLIDFGIARHYKAGQTKDTIPLGSPGYAAPEQYGKAQTTQRADIYSLGALLHQMLSGDDPSETPFQFAPIRAYGEAGFSELRDLITQMVNLDASQRPANVKIIRQHIEEITRQRQKTPPTSIKRVQTRQGSKNAFIPAQPGSQAYSSDYYVPGQTQQQIGTQKKKPLTTRRQLLIGLGAIGFFYGANIAVSAIEGVIAERNMPPQSAFPPISPTNSSQTPGLNRTRIATLNKQELIITLDTSQLLGYDTIHFASADETGLISFWDETYTQRYQIGVGQPVRALSWGPNNGYLLVATEHDVYRIILRELQDGINSLPSDWHMKLNLSNEPITSVALCNNEGNILIADRTGTATVYQPDMTTFQQWTPVKRFPGQNTSKQVNIGNMALTSLESRLATLSSANEVTVWDFHRGQAVQKLAIPLLNNEAVTVLSWHPNGIDLAIGTEKGTTHLWTYNAGDDALHLSSQNATRINGITWDAEGSKYLYDQSNMIVATDQGVAIWNKHMQILQTKIPTTEKENVKAVAVTKFPLYNESDFSTNPTIEYALVTGENFVDFWR
jgi:WD40 repeat protein